MKTVSLELAKKLKEAGVCVKCSFAYVAEHCRCGQHVVEYSLMWLSDAELRGYRCEECKKEIVPSPNVDELFEWLPQEDDMLCLVKINGGEEYWTWYEDEDGKKKSHTWTAYTAADALAKLAIWVKDQPEARRKEENSG